MLGGFYFDPLYFVFVAPALLLAMFAQWRVRSAYSKWSQVRNLSGITGVDVARFLLPRENLHHVRVEGTQGELSDHYDPSSDVLRLSPSIANQPSIASMSVAAHEIGHAAQDRDGYFWLRFRAGIVPFVSIGSSLGYLVFFGGLMLQSTAFAWVGVLLISGGAIFALVTLPVEFDASARALVMLKKYHVFRSAEEEQASRDMLNAAALTYVASATQAILTLLYYVFILLSSSSRRREE